LTNHSYPNSAATWRGVIKSFFAVQVREQSSLRQDSNIDLSDCLIALVKRSNRADFSHVLPIIIGDAGFKGCARLSIEYKIKSDG
jgi:hypothetical protein